MKKVLTLSLSQESIQRAIKELWDFETDLQRKCEEYIDRLAQLGEETALMAINESPLGKTVTLQVNKAVETMGCKAVLIATGGVNIAEGREPFYTLLAIEFGAGIHYNPIPNPKAADLGFGVGTFPGQVHAFEDGWYYLGEDDKWHYSHGVKATMPMYKASAEIISQYKQIAAEVFR